jgi:biopolymer transport protein ExbB
MHKISTKFIRQLAALLALAMLLPGTAQAWWQKDWPYRKQIAVDTTPTGVNVTGAVGRVPVLVRLHSGNFSFADVADNGADLRFVAADDKTPLTHHIEAFDPLLGVATIWVDVPKVSGGEKNAFWLYYGNKNAPFAVNTSGSFDPDYVAVFHFDEAAASPTKDKTAYANNPANGPAGVNDGGIIGRSAKFTSGGIALPASPSLAMTAGGAFSFSTWVNMDAAQQDAALYSRREGGSLVVGLANGVPYVAASGAERLQAAEALPAKQWAHVAATADGKVIKLFVNGKEVASGNGALSALGGVTYVGGDEVAPFAGELDEARISKVARPATMIAADADAQGAQAKLVAYGVDEKQGGGTGVMGYIMSKTEWPEWFVLGICGIMLLIAGLVMWDKSSYLGTANKANNVFMNRYHKMHAGLTSLSEQRDIGADEMKMISKSPLYRLYETGIAELNDRRKLFGNKPLTGESVEAMRAAVDAQQVVENQKLDKWMVMLTIAISGGPFIGLLGTVVGVMKTFGGVALAGDVNVNAIAPGIAAALLATVAGLAVAIPALFGYNYINSRISALADDMRIFVDRLVTRLAETQVIGATPPKMAAE